MTQSELSFALVDKSIFGAAVFRPLCKGVRPRLEVECEFGDEKLKVVATFALGADDLKIFLAIVAMTAVNRIELDPRTDNRAREAIGRLNPKGVAAANKHLVLRTTCYALLREAGMNGGRSDYEQLKGILDRLRGAYYTRERTAGNRRIADSGENLLHYTLDEAGDLEILLSDRLSRAILGDQFMHVSRFESAQLKSAAAVVAHFRLSVAVRKGAMFQIGLDKLAEWIWGKGEPSPAAMRKRRQRSRAAAMEIAALPNWRIELNQVGLLKISRGRG